MTTRLDALAARVLMRAADREPPPPAPHDRANAIAAIERAMRQKRKRRLVTGVSLSMAAAAALAFGATRLLSPAAPQAAVGPGQAPGITIVGHPLGKGATITETGTSAPLEDGRSLGSGSRVVAGGDGNVLVSMSTGTRLTIEEGGDVSVVKSGAEQVFALASGAVRAQVAKLGAGQRFIVRTPDAEVEVHGTSFRVSTVTPDPGCGDGTVSRVEVEEGVVTVRHDGAEVRLTKGESWPPGCAVPSVRPEPRAAKATVAVPTRRPVAAADQKPADLPSTESVSAELPSQLKEQNDCIAQAFSAKRRGATREAIAGFESCVARFPSSPVVENALAQRMRLLASVDRARAVTAAEQYLARYPRGFARKDAEALVEGTER